MINLQFRDIDDAESNLTSVVVNTIKDLNEEKRNLQNLCDYLTIDIQNRDKFEQSNWAQKNEYNETRIKLNYLIYIISILQGNLENNDITVNEED